MHAYEHKLHTTNLELQKAPTRNHTYPCFFISLLAVAFHKWTRGMCFSAV